MTAHGLLCLSFFLFDSACAKTLSVDIVIPSRFNPVGSGARGLCRGRAFIAVADDATAAS